MNLNRLYGTAIGIVCAAIVIATGTTAWAQTVGVVSPSKFEFVEAADFTAPAEVPTRIQFLIPAADFANLPSTHRDLVAWNFRADASQGQYDWTFGNAKVWMSTTDKTSLTLTDVFDDNHGPDKMLVQNGVINFPLLGTGPPAGPRDFADGQRFDAPFYYDPSAGNLLLEFMTISDFPTSPFIDIQFDVGPGVNILLSEGSATAATGILLNAPAVHRFEFVPEPSTVVLLGLSLIGLSFARRFDLCLHFGKMGKRHSEELR